MSEIEYDKLRTGCASDRKMVLAALKKRWPISREVMASFLKDADEVRQESRDTKDHKTWNQVFRTVVLAEGQNQADDHLAEKNERLDSGKATERVEDIVMVMPGVKHGSDATARTDLHGARPGHGADQPKPIGEGGGVALPDGGAGGSVAGGSGAGVGGLDGSVVDGRGAGEQGGGSGG